MKSGLAAFVAASVSPDFLNRCREVAGMSKHCFSCSNTNPNEISNLFGYEVCNSCKPTLGLLKDDTIRKHISSYAKKQEDVPENPSYQEEVDYRLDFMEERYIKTRLKLLHIQQRLKEIG